MSVPILDLPGTDDEGYHHFADLMKAARSISCQGFEQRYPVPALHVVSLEDASASVLEETAVGEVPPQLMTIADPSLRALRYVDRVAFLAKRPGKPFPHFVAVGRTGTNDIVLGLENVSKLHGYFTRSADVWSYTDHDSTNGSFVNGERLAPSDRRALSDGDRLRIGPGVTFEFLSPVTLYSRLAEA